MGLVLCTFAQVGKRLQDPPAEGSHGVLHTGAQTEHALQVRLFQQQLSVCAQLMRSAQESSHAVHKLRNQTRVRVISLTVMIRHHLQREPETALETSSDLHLESCNICCYLYIIIYNIYCHIYAIALKWLFIFRGIIISNKQSL